MTTSFHHIHKVRPSDIVRYFLMFILILSPIAPAAACLWDYDTLQMERSAFPGALELIVGKFLRHSDPFYEWRVEDRSAKIAAHDAGEISLDDEQIAAAYDDWAAALDKLGRHEKAIEIINEKAERLPKIGQYETHANRGTFLIHAGRLEEGVAELKKALEINPEAHFGREEYQVLLVEYVLEKRGDADEVSLPLNRSGRIVGPKGGPFVRWILEQQGMGGSQDAHAIATEIQRATKGILGMMRFGNYQSPILLEALGDLLASQHGNTQGQRLAARAYLRAAMEVEDKATRDAYREMARQVVGTQMTVKHAGSKEDALTLEQLEDQLAREMHEARDWFERVAEDEALWVAESTDPNPDERFWQKYGEQVIEVGHDRLPPARFLSDGLPWQIQVTMGAIAIFMVGLVLALLAWRRRRPTGYE